MSPDKVDEEHYEDDEDFEEEEIDIEEEEEDEKVAEDEDRRQGMRARALPADGDPCLLYTSDAADE